MARNTNKSDSEADKARHQIFGSRGVRFLLMFRRYGLPVVPLPRKTEGETIWDYQIIWFVEDLDVTLEARMSFFNPHMKIDSFSRLAK